MRQVSLVSKSTPLERRSFVRHGRPGRAEELHRGVVEEVGDARGVEVCVVLDLLTEAGVLISLFEDESPIFVRAALESRLQLEGFEQRGLEGTPQLLQI